MKKSNLLILALPFLVASCGSSTSTSTNTTPEVEQTNKYEGTVAINAFENQTDLYRVKQLLHEISYGTEIQLDINHEFHKVGEGSLEVTYGNNIYGQIYQRLALTEYPDAPVNNIKSVSLWVYNDNENPVSMDLNVIGKEHAVLSTYTEEVAPKTWQLVTYELNKVAIDAIYKDVRGFSFEFAKLGQYPAHFYVDEFAVTFGVEASEEDKHYQEIVDSLVRRIDALPPTVKASDTKSIEECKDIASIYSALPTAYKVAITNYATFQAAMQSYVDDYAEAEATESDVTAFHFDECFGLAQTSFSYVQTQFGIGVSTEVKVDGQEGSLDLDFNGEADWLSFNATSSVNFQDYDYIEFSVYNATEANIGFCLTWDTLHNAPAGEWTTYRIPTKYKNFEPSYLIEFEITSVDPTVYGNGDAHAPVGHMYISKVTLHRASATTFLEMLNALPTNITLDNEQQVKEVRAFYDSLHKDEKAKISTSDYNRLLAAERAIVSASFPLLSGLIDSLPNTVSCYHGPVIYRAWEIYSTMNNADKAKYITTAQENKLKTVRAYYVDNFETVFNASTLAGESTGISWDVRAKATAVEDATYSESIMFKLTDVANMGSGNMAFEFPVSADNVADYTSVTFYVKAPQDVTFYASRSDWRGGVNNLGYVCEKKVVANTWTEITIPASDFAQVKFMEFYLTVEPTVGEEFYMTNIYGNLK